MVRAPCCDKMRVKTGRWTPEEDRILKAYVEEHGPGNWRALPKQAGLARCGKSCRFRWRNYLHPDIKRGNYTKHEEETIIKLHAKFGNRWSMIAAGLPGRTDNEVKNVWHTHLKKLQQKHFPVRPKVSLINTKATGVETASVTEMDISDRKRVDDSIYMLMRRDENCSSKPVDLVQPTAFPQVGLLEPESTGPDDGEEDIMAFWLDILMKLNDFQEM